MFDIKVFGERNTSTNALKQIIESNSRSRCCPGTGRELDPAIRQRIHSLGAASRAEVEAEIDRVFEGRPEKESWKHCATGFDSAEPFSGLTVFFLVRHPVSWLLSLFKHPYHVLETMPESLEDFLDFEWKTLGRERLGQAAFKPLSLYEAKLRTYIGFHSLLEEAGIPCLYLRFEDIILKQGEVFESIAGRLREPNAEFRELETSTKSASKSLDDYKKIYGEEQWRKDFHGLEAMVNARIDWDLVSEFGYRPL